MEIRIQDLKIQFENDVKREAEFALEIKNRGFIRVLNTAKKVSERR